MCTFTRPPHSALWSGTSRSAPNFQGSCADAPMCRGDAWILPRKRILRLRFDILAEGQSCSWFFGKHWMAVACLTVVALIRYRVRKGWQMLMFQMSVAKESVEVYTWSGGWLVMNLIKRSLGLHTGMLYTGLSEERVMLSQHRHPQWQHTDCCVHAVQG